ncbi:MAG TPA: acetate/propionate family kinase [Ferrovibrio sp.]|jgi:acetate kinase|uniref:acetate/propionate family kinase n=1 Tax=Ferrovibrio sp. TaxID=1917215 RepID=UPI002B4B5B45|nr:acetate/propionate family kinase [Ferrovibrio sp.]HLT77535.1 acetate/propionate family kinase [Ferrovibrio sp.]
MQGARDMTEETVLALNAGSSSIKFALFRRGDPPCELARGALRRLGQPGTTLSVRREGENRPGVTPVPPHADPVGFLLGWLRANLALDDIVAIGHRVVSGGPEHSVPEWLSPALLEDLRRYAFFAPDHMPAAIALIERLLADLNLPQIVCFDTAFHAALPTEARLLPIPRRFAAQGIHRYGYHGLSYAYLMDRFRRQAGPEAAGGRIILAHLGSGSSLAAVSGGRSRDTTMSFTPNSGIPMGTRSGDIDPGIVEYLVAREGLAATEVHRLLAGQSGLLGLSETTADMADLLALAKKDERAAEAVAVYCYEIRKCIGAYAAALGGIDTLIFSGGIGENAPEIRARICSGLGFLGIEIDHRRNTAGEERISPEAGRVGVHVFRTDEEVMIARAMFDMLQESRAAEGRRE